MTEVVRDLQVALVVMVGQAGDGDAQSDHRKGHQKHHDEDERPIHLRQMEKNGIAFLIQVFQAGVVTIAETDGRQAEADQGAGDDD